MKHTAALVRGVQTVSDRALAVFVPTARAAADNFTQYCGCWGTLHSAHYWYRTCAWEGAPGQSQVDCLPCYNSWINCG
jgi:hypothetical protein